VRPHWFDGRAYVMKNVLTQGSLEGSFGLLYGRGSLLKEEVLIQGLGSWVCWC